MFKIDFTPESFFFFPDSINHAGHPENDELRFKTIKIKSTDEVVLDGWFIFSESETPKATIIHFHGNAANITNHWNFVNWIPKLGFDLICFDYRGYGKTKGQPSFQGVFDDCCAVIDFARREKSIVRNKSFIILGQSLGSAFSISATAEKLDKDILGMIIDSTFNSFRDIVNLKVPLIPVKYIHNLITDSFDPEKAIEQLNIPKLFIHSNNDPVVPYKLGKKLYEIAPEPKDLLEYRSSVHLSLLLNFDIDNPYCKKVVSFLDNLTTDVSQSSEVISSSDNFTTDAPQSSEVIYSNDNFTQKH